MYGETMDKSRSRITLYALAGIAALAAPVLFFDGARNNPLLPSLAPALLAIALLTRNCLLQLDAAHSLSSQLGEMIEHRDTRHLVVPGPSCPEMNAIGHQLNVLIYTMTEARLVQSHGHDTARQGCSIDLGALPDAA